MSVGLLVGGFETTAHMIGKSLLWLFQHPDHLAALRADLGLVPTAVEELLRHIPLAGGVSLPFIASEDVELPGAGARIEAGEYVMPALAGANLDDAAFACAAEVRLDRSPNPHVSFGYGAHYCLGAHLARMEMQVAFDALLRRFPRPRARRACRRRAVEAGQRGLGSGRPPGHVLSPAVGRLVTGSPTISWT